MTSIKVNSDLERERSTCTFNIEELTNLLDTGAEHTAKRRALEERIFNVKELKDVVPEEFLSHKDKYENAIRKAVILYSTLRSEDSGKSVYDSHDKSNFRNTSNSIFKDVSPFLLHFSMFMATILGQGDEEQKKYWFERASKMEIIGTYAQKVQSRNNTYVYLVCQSDPEWPLTTEMTKAIEHYSKMLLINSFNQKETELGHGTFIRGLETEARYDEETEEFVIHSPTPTSYKWWPGGLGQSSNYCIVMAQLQIKGKSYGMQLFIVQIRDEETYMPMPGVKVGEIGAKMSFNTVNNGFLGFDNVRIPRRHMLMKFSQVTKDGIFKSSSNPKLAYGTMVLVRATILNTASTLLAKAATIAVRYSAVRHQSQLKSNEPEAQILDYVTQQHKLFISIATSHAYMFSSYWLWDLYTTYRQEQSVGNFDRLPELHALTCVLKVISSADCTALVERCRQSCGGHGFMLSSYLPQLYGLSTAACTYEGENTVLLLQTARSLVKAWDQASQGIALSPTMSYLADQTPAGPWDSSLDGIIKAFQKVSFGKLSSSVSSFREYAKSGLSLEDAWNRASVQLIAAAEAYGRAVLLSVYKAEIERYKKCVSPSLHSVLSDLLEIYITYMALEKTGDLLLYTQLSEKDVKALQRRYENLLEKIRPNAVGLVDAFDYRDEVLHSTLGAYDGFAYEHLMTEAMKSPLNSEPVNKSFHQYIKPMMKGKI